MSRCSLGLSAASENIDLTFTKELCEELYRKHAPAAFRRAQRMLGSVSDADEVVHDVFLQLFERPQSFRGHSQLSTYLHSAVTHACLNRIRNRRLRLRLNDNVADVQPVVDPGTSAEATAMLRDLLAQLPETLALVAVYHYLDELSNREIGSLLGCSHSHVGQLLRRLASWLEEKETVCSG